MRCAAKTGRPVLPGNVPVTAYDAWRAEVELLEDAYRSVNHEGPGEAAAFQSYMDGTRSAWSRFAKADPETAARLFAENMLAVSAASSR